MCRETHKNVIQIIGWLPAFQEAARKLWKEGTTGIPAVTASAPGLTWQDGSMNHSEDPVAGIRIGHAECEAVIDTLRDAAADGRLTLDELDERIGCAAEARVFGDLDALVADLPVRRPSDQLRPLSAPH